MSYIRADEVYYLSDKSIQRIIRKMKSSEPV